MSGTLAFQILRGVASIGLARGIAIALDGLCYLVVARYLGPAEYGQYLALMAFLTLIDITGDMTLLDITVRDIANDPDRTGTWVCAGTVLRLAMSAVGCGLYALYVVLGPGHRTPDLRQAAWIAALILPAGALRMPLAAFRAHLKMEYELVIVAITRVVNLACFLACVQQGAGLSWLFLSVLASRMVLAALAWTALRRLPGTTLGIDAAAIRHLVREAIPMAVSGAFVALQLKGDILMMAAMAGASIAGLYGAVAQLPEYLLAIPVIVTTPMLPVLSRLFSEHDHRRFSELYQNLFDAVVAAAVPVAIVAALVPDRLLTLFLGERFAEAAPAMPLLMLTVAAMWASHAIAIAAVAARLQKTFVLIQALSVVVYGVLNWVLIPRFTMVGAAFSRSVATGLAAVLTYRMLKRRTGCALDPGRLRRIGFAGLLMASAVAAAGRLPLPAIVTIGAAVYLSALWACSGYPNVLTLVRERT